jgi:hypothetical protein
MHRADRCDPTLKTSNRKQGKRKLKLKGNRYSSYCTVKDVSESVCGLRRSAITPRSICIDRSSTTYNTQIRTLITLPVSDQEAHKKERLSQTDSHSQSLQCKADAYGLVEPD